MSDTSYGTDGALDRMLRLGQKTKYTPAIFIHAGAGFHSQHNEHHHLKVCVAATEMGMKFLRAGATATEAVEASLRVLEDNDITNAGYGSNLSIDGAVECDATIVDHLGRSGACGAVPNIGNPISLAKLILDRSNQPLSLRRVPPNILVGEGARDFAEEHGMATLPNEQLISKNAGDRFYRWRDDLERAEGKLKDTKNSVGPEPGSLSCDPCQYSTDVSQEPGHTFPRDHTAAIMSGTWNEGQPDSPYRGTPVSEAVPAPEPVTPTTYFRSPGTASATVGRSPVRATPERSSFSPASPSNNGAASPRPRVKAYNSRSEQPALKTRKSPVMSAEAAIASYRDALLSFEASKNEKRTGSTYQGTVGNGRLFKASAKDSTQGVKRPFAQNGEPQEDERSTKPFSKTNNDEDDLITDTIGAIAIDDKGCIAAGSSSGGIGMKHRGRLGPAAIVGIGTAVVPAAEDDEQDTTVAAVTSGTGEHMATTMASQRCAERIYFGTRKGPAGAEIQEDDESVIMESFIADDFMNHPGVKQCHLAGAIGVMVVKKTRSGYYLYFAHNTDSFALASMGATEKEPQCTMSRLPKGAKIAQGARKIRVD